MYVAVYVRGGGIIDQVKFSEGADELIKEMKEEVEDFDYETGQASVYDKDGWCVFNLESYAVELGIYE